MCSSDLMLDEVIPLRKDGRNVQSVARNSFSHTRNCFREIEHLDRAKQSLARIAPEVMALSSDQTILDERYLEARRRKLPHGGYTADTAT